MICKQLLAIVHLGFNPRCTKQTTHKNKWPRPSHQSQFSIWKASPKVPWISFLATKRSQNFISLDPRFVTAKIFFPSGKCFYSSVRTYQCKCKLSIKILSLLFWTEPQGLSPFWVRSVWYHIFIYGIIHFGPKTALVPVNGTRLIKAFEEINYSF